MRRGYVGTQRRLSVDLEITAVLAIPLRLRGHMILNRDPYHWAVAYTYALGRREWWGCNWGPQIDDLRRFVRPV